eukprot:RCo004409
MGARVEERTQRRQKRQGEMPMAHQPPPPTLFGSIYFVLHLGITLHSTRLPTTLRSVNSPPQCLRRPCQMPSRPSRGASCTKSGDTSMGIQNPLMIAASASARLTSAVPMRTRKEE